MTSAHLTGRAEARSRDVIPRHHSSSSATCGPYGEGGGGAQAASKSAGARPEGGGALSRLANGSLTALSLSLTAL